MKGVTRMQDSTHFSKRYDESKGKFIFTPCSSADEGAIEMGVRQIPDGSGLSIPFTTVVCSN